MKNFSRKLSLQWRLTLITALLVTITCILMYFFISQSAVTGMDHLQNYIVQINKTDSSPITFNIDPTILFPDLSEQVTTTKQLFQIRSLITTVLIILLSSACTYFVSHKNNFLPVPRMSFAHPLRSCRQIWKFFPARKSPPLMNIRSFFP